MATPPSRAGGLVEGACRRRQIGHHCRCVLVRLRFGDCGDPALQLVDLEPALGSMASQPLEQQLAVGVAESHVPGYETRSAFTAVP